MQIKMRQFRKNKTIPDKVSKVTAVVLYRSLGLSPIMPLLFIWVKHQDLRVSFTLIKLAL